MAGSPPPPLPPPPPPPAPTTITALGEDLLREIFLRLPDVTTLARAAFACRAFLHAVRSSPAFRRCFRQLHAPPLLALFTPLCLRAVVPAASGKGGDIAAAFDFDDLFQDSDTSEWWGDPDVPYEEWYASFFNRATYQAACYSPHSQALKIYSRNLRYDEDDDNTFLEFYTLCPDDEEQRPSRVVCVRHDRARAGARVAVFSSNTMDWQVVLPEMDTGGPLLKNNRYAIVAVAGGFICWVHQKEGCVLALDTATFQFSRMDLPPSIGKFDTATFQFSQTMDLPPSIGQFHLGQTKDGELCLVGVLKLMLSVWLWAADDGGVGRFMLHKTFSLCANVSKVTEHSDVAGVSMRPMAVINGFLYLSVACLTDPQSSHWFMSFCLETDEVNLLHKESQFLSCADPYTMVRWPSSLISSKDSETGVTGNISEDDGPIVTEEVSPVLFTALQTFKEKLIDDGNSNFAEIESLLDDEMNSLLNRIASLESGLAAARDRVLRIGTVPSGMNGEKSSLRSQD